MLDDRVGPGALRNEQSIAYAREPGLGLRRAAVLGCLFGALGGAWVALGDFGASWLWLPLWRDRAGLLWRLVALLSPIGALAGAASAAGLALLWTVSAQAGQSWRRRLFPILVVLPWLPALRQLAVKLCSGGMMSRLPYHGLVEWSLTLALPVLGWAAILCGRLIATAVARGRLSARRLGAALLGLSFGLGKVNQVVLPNLYLYLHGALAALVWLSASLGLFVLAHALPAQHQARRLLRPTRAVAGGVALALAGLLLANLATLDQHLNVRVALFDARTPTSRALLTAADPWLRAVLARTPARPASALASRRVDTRGLTQQPGAHVLLVTIDALRADHLGLYGYGRPVSPRLDAWARQAMIFEHAYAQAPHSSYSLSSLHTSEYIHELVDLQRGLPRATLAGVMREHGYHTAAFFTDGIFHTEGHRLGIYRDSAFGFALFDHTDRSAEDQTDRVLAEIDRIVEQGEPPSLLWVHYFDVHEPYRATTFGTRDVDRYDSEIARVDQALTRLFAEAEQRLSRDLIIAITADHGEEFREHGGVYHGSTVFEEQVRVPLLLFSDALAAQRVATPVEVVDLAPTLLGMAGLPVPESMRGRDLRAIAAGRERAPAPVFSAVLTKRMVVRWPYKLVADLRFNLFELYDLERDPNERNNLASTHPKELEELRGLIYGWLDSLEAPSGDGAAGAEDSWARALRWGRLGDRRAVEPMTRLLLDTRAPTPMRVEAGQILARLADPASTQALVQGLWMRPEEVAAEAAIALGRMHDARARQPLRKLVHAEDPFLRARAAISLGRLRDPEAVPALIDALWVAPTQYEREEAVRWLGRLRDPRAIEPLLSVAPEFGLRYLVVVALGQIGDPRAFEPLMAMLAAEDHATVRDELIRGLGLLGDVRAVPALLRVLAREPGLGNTGESLIRLGAIEAGQLSGLDVHRRTRGPGFSRCHEGPRDHDWDYRERTYCVFGPTGALRLRLAEGAQGSERGARLIVRVRRMDAATPAELRISADAQRLGPVQVDGTWREHRLAVDLAPRDGQDSLTLRFVAQPPEARIAVDHVLLVATPAP